MMGLSLDKAECIVNRIFKQAFAAGSGTILQWYDFSLFGYMAPLLATLFFPAQSPLASLLYTFAAFAVSYLLAPLGACFFGYIGDNFGRKKALTLSILAMALPTALISILPSYETAGLSAAVLLTLFRVTQGLVASAEYAGSAIFLVEHAPGSQKCFYGSLTSSAYSLGSTLAALVAGLASLQWMPNWAWRLPFALAFVAGLLLFYMRRNLSETPDFNRGNHAQREKTSFLTAFKQYPASVLCTILIALFIGVLTFGTYVFATTYMNLYGKLPLSTAIAFTSIALLVDAALEPFIAILADRWGAKLLSMLGVWGVILLSYPLFQLLSSGSGPLALAGMLALSSLIALTCAPLNAFLVSLFPPSCRFSGFAVSFNLSMALSAALPFLMTGCIAYSGKLLAPAAFYIVSGFGALIALQLAKAPKFRLYVLENPGNQTLQALREKPRN